MGLYRSIFVLALTAVSNVIAFSVAANPASIPHADARKVLRYAFEVAETGFDPAQISDWYSSIINEQIFDTPLHYDYLARPVKLKPNLLEMSQDHRCIPACPQPKSHAEP